MLVPNITDLNDITPMSDDEIRRRTESLIENIGALRFALSRIEILEGYERLARDLLADCQEIVSEHSEALAKRITKALNHTGRMPI